MQYSKVDGWMKKVLLSIRKRDVRASLTSRNGHAVGASGVFPREMAALLGCCLVAIAGWSARAEDETDSGQELRVYIEQYSADLRTLDHRFRLPLDKHGIDQRLQVYDKWLKSLKQIDFGNLSRVNQIDYLLLRSELEYQQEYLELQHSRDLAAAELIPGWKQIVSICRNRENVVAIEPAALAGEFSQLASHVEAESGKIRSQDSDSQDTELRLKALRASQLIERLSRCLRETHGFYSGYDPEYSWWAKKPMESLQAALEAHRKVLREQVLRIPDEDQETIVGQPIGADGLALELKHEWIAHSPSELVDLAKREMRWCDEEMAKASQELGFGDDWKAAMEHVKTKHVAPGDQPQLIRDLAWEAIRFLEANDLVTIPGLAANGWRMTMMSPERQRVNPYFLGGDTIIVSYPTDEMTHEEKLMSMRSNNEHFSRATVHHELIPGHHLQRYMTPRYRPYRRVFSTPFWIEGWALYWEMLLWDLEFQRSAEDKVGMLFWRKHRCARIIFSLSYHLGEMTPEECVDYLVERVGHERSAAAAEVRRSIMGGYSPLYQAAYMLGGLQLRELHAELVQNGELSNREFHDAVLHENSIPIEILRLYLTKASLKPDLEASWRFADAANE